MKKTIIALLFATLCAIACAPGLDPEEIDSGSGTVDPAADDRVHLTVAFDTNLQDFIDVQYTLVGLNGKSRYGVLRTSSTHTLDWYTKEGTVKVAFLAQQKEEFSSKLLSSGITFSVSVSLQTPTDGYEVKWCGLKDTVVESDDTLYDYTIKALNKGLYGQPEGTGNTKYLEFSIFLDPQGGYKITAKWVKGNIIQVAA